MYMSVMMSMSEARARLPYVLDQVEDVLDQVEAGEEVTVTRHGRPVAVLVRPDRLRLRRSSAALEAAGDLARRLAEARTRPLASPSLGSDRADELADQAQTDRDAR